MSYVLIFSRQSMQTEHTENPSQKGFLEAIDDSGNRVAYTHAFEVPKHQEGLDRFLSVTPEARKAGVTTGAPCPIED